MRLLCKHYSCGHACGHCGLGHRGQVFILLKEVVTLHRCVGISAGSPRELSAVKGRTRRKRVLLYSYQNIKYEIKKKEKKFEFEWWCSVAKSCPTLFNPQTAAHQASLSLTVSQSLLKIIFNESVMPSNHLILCYPLLLLPSIFPSIRVFSNESAVRIR